MHGPHSVRNSVLYLLLRWSSSITGEQWFEEAKMGPGKCMAIDLQLGAVFWADLQTTFIHGGLGLG